VSIVKYKVFLYAVLFSTMPLANVITNADIELLSISSPSGWKTYNSEQLFDGISDRYTQTRFAAYQKKGDLLSDDNTYDISLKLIDAISVNSLGFYNDWRHHLGQQVTAMSVSLYNESRGLLWSNSFDDLKQNSWDEIKLVSFSSAIGNVSQIDFKVTGAHGNHFEIRELLVGYSRLPALQRSSSQVNTPSIAFLFVIAITALVVGRKKLFKK
jgi:hypothetical protein